MLLTREALPALALFALTVGGESFAAKYYVAACGNDDWSGLSPDCKAPDGPKRHIQSALNASDDGDEIIVAAGTYNESINFNGKAVNLRSATGADSTIISGGGRSESVVTCASGESPDSILDGFTVRDGRGTALNDGYEVYGGGMYNLSASPTVKNCIFTANGGRYEGDLGTIRCRGAGMYNFRSAVQVSNCLFLENEFIGHRIAPAGGGMYNDLSAPTVIDCTFRANQVMYDEIASGGGIFSVNSDVTITRCTFVENACDHAGAGICSVESHVTITDSTFEKNVKHTHELDWGGGGGVYSLATDAIVDGCRFLGNRANTGAGLIHDIGVLELRNSEFRENSGEFAGGAYLIGWAFVTNCAFVQNKSDDRFGVGAGGLAIIGGFVDSCMFVRNSSTRRGVGGLFCQETTLMNCTIAGNVGRDAGGVISAGQSAIISCVFAGNHCTQDTGGAGGMFANDVAAVANCTFAGNSGGGAIYNAAKKLAVTNCVLWGDTPFETAGDPIDVRYSAIQGGLAGEGNIDTDPTFIRNPDPGPDEEWGTDDDDYGDLRLASGSPCIDAGDPAFTAPPGETDLAGLFRIWDGNADGDAIVDMGAYEFGSFALGDLNCDGGVNFNDIDAFVAALHDRENYEQRYPDCAHQLADINADRSVDFDDIDAFVHCVVNGGCERQ